MLPVRLCVAMQREDGMLPYQEARMIAVVSIVTVLCLACLNDWLEHGRDRRIRKRLRDAIGDD